MANVFCDVCEQRLPEETVYRAVDFMGQTYYFCSLEDQEKFIANPDPFVKRDRQNQLQFSGPIEPQLSTPSSRK